VDRSNTLLDRRQVAKQVVKLGDFLLERFDGVLKLVGSGEGILEKFSGLLALAAAGSSGRFRQPPCEFLFVLTPTELDTIEGFSVSIIHIDSLWFRRLVPLGRIMGKDWLL
jgi:hypothetical protein